MVEFRSCSRFHRITDFFMKITPTGMVPNEDTGTIMGVVTLPPGTSQERAQEVLNRVDSLVAAEPAVASRTVISGYSFIGGQGPSYGSIIIKLKTGTNVPQCRIQTSSTSRSLCVHKRLSRKRRYCSSLLR